MFRLFIVLVNLIEPMGNTVPLSSIVDFLSEVNDTDTKGRFIQYIDWMIAAGIVEVDETGCPVPTKPTQKIRFSWQSKLPLMPKKMRLTWCY